MSFAAIVFLFYLCVLLPFLAWRSSRRLASTQAPISRLRAYVSTGFQMVLNFWLAYLAARSSHINLYPAVNLGLREYAIGAAALVLLLTSFFVGMKRQKTSTATQWLAPQTAGETLLFLLLIALTAFVEESSYRGAAFQLFSRMFNNQPLAALAASIAFGLAHRVQGQRAVFVTILYGLFDQIVVVLTGTLYVMMVVHFLYDLIAGLVLSRYAKPVGT